MKNPFYFLAVILIFLSACKQEPTNSIPKISVSKNVKSVATIDTSSTIEKEKLAPKIDPKKGEKKFPFPPPPPQNFEEIGTPISLEDLDDLHSSGNYYNPEKIQEGDVVQEGPLVNTIRQDEPYTIVDEQAEFPGGKLKFIEYIEKNLKLTSEMKVGGKCYLRFVVGVDGSISNVVILKGVRDCPECDKEAKRLVQNMPKWIPAKINGKKVNSYYVVPIQFAV